MHRPNIRVHNQWRNLDVSLGNPDIKLYMRGRPEQMGVDYWMGLNRWKSISSLEELLKIGSDPDYPATFNYYLTTNIDASPIDNWLPLCKTAMGFRGIFDGLGFSISNITCNRPNDVEVGLFSRITFGRVRNLRMYEINVTGRTFVGCVAGYMSGSSLISVYVEGNVNGISVYDVGLYGGFAGGLHVGGLAGRMIGGSSSNPHYYGIDECAFKGAVQGRINVGGLVGELSGTTSGTNVGVKDSYTWATLKGTSNIGGLAGLAELQRATKSYAIVNISSRDEVSGEPSFFPYLSNVGGLIGFTGFAASGVSLQDCYSKGEVAPYNENSIIGGLIGRCSSPNINGGVFRCFSDIDVYGVSNIGGLIGWNAWPVVECYAEGNVTGESYKEFVFPHYPRYAQYLGGLIGRQEWGTASSPINVRDSYATGDVLGIHNEGTMGTGYNGQGGFGGLVGANLDQWGSGYSSKVVDSYAEGNVTGLWEARTGTLIGHLKRQTEPNVLEYGYSYEYDYPADIVFGQFKPYVFVENHWEPLSLKDEKYFR